MIDLDSYLRGMAGGMVIMAAIFVSKPIVIKLTARVIKSWRKSS